jgi:hypothetical protein
MNMNSRNGLVVLSLSLLPFAMASGCVLDKESLGDPNGDTEGDDAASAEGSGTGDTSATSGASATTSAGSVSTSSEGSTTDGDCTGQLCGACLPGCDAVDECVDGELQCECVCDDATGEVLPRVCPDDAIDVSSQLAYRYADLPSSGGGGDTGGSGSTSASTSAGDDPDPDTLFIRLGTEPLACGETPTYACDNWRVSISIPPQYQEPGIYDLDDTDIAVTYSIQGPPSAEDPEDCFFGGGGGFGGTLEIFAIDDETVHGAFCSDDLSEVMVDGVFTAQRC